MLVQLSSDRQGSIAIIKLIFKVHCPNKIFLKRIKDTNVFVPKSQRERERERERERGNGFLFKTFYYFWGSLYFMRCQLETFEWLLSVLVCQGS